MNSYGSVAPFKVWLQHYKFPDEGAPADVPLLSLYLPVPVDKAPPMVTWAKFAPSIWSAWEGNREPLEIRPLSHDILRPGDALALRKVGVCRGYSRATIIGFGICQTLMIEDQTSFSEEQLQEFDRPGQHSKQVIGRSSLGRVLPDLVLAKPSRQA